MALADARRRRKARRAPSSTLSRTERRARIAHRRGVAALVGALAAAAVVLVAWFPAGALIAQRRTLAQTTSTLAQLRAEDRALRAESKNLATPSEIARIARQQFQLIAPGEQAYQILPPPGRAGGATDPYSGDPGASGLAASSGAAELPPGTVVVPGTPGAGRSSTQAAATKSGPGLLGRVLRALEFWK